MIFDLKLIHELCQEIGLRSCIQSDVLLDIELSEECILFFQNTEVEDDCLVGLRGAPCGASWHTHGNFLFTDCRGYYTELSYLDVVSGLKDGVILVCERWRGDQLVDRSLIHRDFNNEFRYLDETEAIRVRRAVVSSIKHDSVA